VRSHTRELPNAHLVADKVHVLRLVQPAIYRYLKQLELGRDALPLYKPLCAAAR
jgi:hypothetical protein